MVLDIVAVVAEADVFETRLLGRGRDTFEPPL
jgi:ribose 1,5-bisphosphokinase PhnN